MNVRSHAAVIAAFALLCALAALLLPRIETDNRFELWLRTSASETGDYDRFREKFGSDEFILAAVQQDPPFAADRFDRVATLAAELETVDGIERVVSLPTLYREIYGGEDIEALREEVESAPFYERLLISPDRETLGVFVHMAVDGGGDARRRVVDAVTSSFREAGIEARFVGPPVLNVALDRISARELSRSLPLSLLLSGATLLVFLRSVRAVLVAGISSAVTLLATLAAMPLAGKPLTMVTSAMPALLFVLSLSSSIHLVVAYRRQMQEASAADALRAAIGRVRRPCFLSALTTAAGFLSLTTSSFPAIRDFGLMCAIGLVISLVVTFTLGRSLLALLGAGADGALPRRVASLTETLVAASARQPARPCLGFGLLAVGCAVSLPLLRVDANPLRFLDRDEKVVRDYVAVGEALTGMSSLEVVVALPAPFTDPATWSGLEDLATTLSREPNVARVVSPLDALKKLRQWEHDLEPDAYRLPRSGEEARRLVDEADPFLRRELETLTADGGRTVRLTALVDTMDSQAFLELADRTDAALAEGLFSPASGVTGLALELVRAQRHIIDSQLDSLALAMVLIFVSIWVGLASLRMTLLAAAPNFFPLLAVFAFMGMWRVPLDPGTVMVAGVALGIAVDNTVHLLVATHGRRRRPAASASRLGRSAAKVGPALFATTLAVVSGFTALLRSGFVPIHYFALLSIVAMAAALAADLVLLPAILFLGRASGPKELR